MISFETIKSRQTQEPIINENLSDPEALHISHRLIDAMGLTHGPFSGLATYYNPETKEEERISPALDKIMAENFSNMTYIVKTLNGIGNITTPDPRERYEGELDDILQKTKEDFDTFKTETEKAKEQLEQDKTDQKISQDAYQKGLEIFSQIQTLYEILVDEITLKKRGVDNILKLPNTNLDILYAPGGEMTIIREYLHSPLWQEIYGDKRGGEINLASIYKRDDIRLVAIEPFFTSDYGKCLDQMWRISQNETYEILMQELIHNEGKNSHKIFCEIDSRHGGKHRVFSFDNRELKLEEAEVMFRHLQNVNPQKAQIICKDSDMTKCAETYREFYYVQRTLYDPTGEGKNLTDRDNNEGLAFRQDETRHHNIASVDHNFQTKSSPTGMEMGPLATSDALSALRLSLLMKAMHEGKLASGIIVDFQGADHRHLKSYYFRHLQEAIQLARENPWEILANHPNVKNTQDILHMVENMTADTWRWIITFIATVPNAVVVDATQWKNQITQSIFLRRQRPMKRQKDFLLLTEEEIERIVVIVTDTHTP